RRTRRRHLRIRHHLQPRSYRGPAHATSDGSWTWWSPRIYSRKCAMCSWTTRYLDQVACHCRPPRLTGVMAVWASMDWRTGGTSEETIPGPPDGGENARMLRSLNDHPPSLVPRNLLT